MPEQWPAYERIARDVRERVRRGELGPGAPIPSERELIEQSGTSRGTVNKAVALLRAWGVITTEIGVGSRVVGDPDAGSLASGPDEHTERIRLGLPIYGPGESSVIYEASVITTDHVSSDVLGAVDLPESPRDMAGEATRIVKRARVMRRDEQIVGACTTWLPHPLIAQQGPRGAELLDRLTSTTERFPGGTGAAVAALYGRELTRSVTRAGVRPLPVSVARELRRDPGVRVLWMLVARYADEYVVEADEWFRLCDVTLG